MATNIHANGIGEAIERELTIYSTNIMNVIKTEAKDHMKELVKETRKTAPKGHRKKHYKSNITSRRVKSNYREVEYQWFVKNNDYRLTHLLEHGHALRNGGRTRATNFVANASEPILADFQRKIEEAIQNG